jgi:hypothetical protein
MRGAKLREISAKEYPEYKGRRQMPSDDATGDLLSEIREALAEFDEPGVPLPALVFSLVLQVRRLRNIASVEHPESGAGCDI